MAAGVAGLENAAHGVGSGLQDAAWELIDVIFAWIVPIVTLIIGYLMSAAIGLSGALGTLIDSVLGAVGIAAATMCYIAVAIAVLIWGAIAGGLWAAQHKAGKYGMYILRPLATLFGGFALGEIPAGLKGQVNNGSLGKLAASTSPLTG